MAKVDDFGPYDKIVEIIDDMDADNFTLIMPDGFEGIDFNQIKAFQRFESVAINAVRNGKENFSTSQRSNITANVRTNISGDGGSTFSVGLTTKLSELPSPLSEKYKNLKVNQ